MALSWTNLLTLTEILFLISFVSTYLLFGVRHQFSEGEIGKVVHRLYYTSFFGMCASFFFLMRDYSTLYFFEFCSIVFLVLFAVDAFYTSHTVYALGRELGFNEKKRRLWLAVVVDKVFDFFRELIDDLLEPIKK